MPAILSRDLRWRIIFKCFDERGLSREEIAAHLLVDVSSVTKWKDRFEATGDIASETEIRGRAVGRGRYKTLPISHLAALQDMIRVQPYLYLDELVDELATQGMYARGTSKWSLSAICMALRRLQLTRKKLKYESHRVCEEERASYRRGMGLFYAEMLVFLDETARNTKGMRRKYGRAPPGVTPVSITVPGTGPSHSILALCGVEGFLAWDHTEGAYNAGLFMAAFRLKILPHLQAYPAPHSVLVLDNCSIHHTYEAELEALVATAGARIVWLPPYSPMYSPIEYMFATLKSWFRAHYHWVAADVERGIEAGMRSSVTIATAARTYEHCGYRCSAEAAAFLTPYLQGNFFVEPQ